MTALSAAAGIDEHDLVELIHTLAARHLTVATAESLTGGLLAALLTETPGSSAVFRGGIVCYATDLKASLVGVDSPLLDRVGAVHSEVAEQLAAGAARSCEADIGLGVTGVAGPDPQDDQPVGTVFVAIRAPGRHEVRRMPPTSSGGVGGSPSRQEIRFAAVRTALQLLRGVIER